MVYNRIKMLYKMDTLSMGKRACIYDEKFRAQILFSKLEALDIELCSYLQNILLSIQYGI